MNLLSNSCQQTGKKSENRKNGPTHKPATMPPQKFLLLLRYNLFISVDKMRVKNITVTVSVRVRATVRVSLVVLFCITVSVRVSVTVRVSLVLFVSSNIFGASSVAICRRCVYKILVAFAQRCVYNKSVAFYTRLCILYWG